MDILRRAFTPNWPSLDQEQRRLPLATKRAEVIKPVIEGRVARQKNDVVVVGTRRDRDVVFRIWITFGTTTIELKLGSKMPGKACVQLRYDPDRDSNRGGPPPIDAKEPRWVYLAGHVGFRGSEETVARWKELCEKLPAEPFTALLAELEREKGHLLVNRDSVHLKVAASCLLSGDAPAIFTQRLDRLRLLADAMEAGWR